MPRRTQSSKRKHLARQKPQPLLDYAQEEQKARIARALADAWAKAPAGTKYSDIVLPEGFEGRARDHA